MELPNKKYKIIYADKNGNVPKHKLTPSMRSRNRTMIIRDTPCRDWWIDIPVIGCGGNKEITYGRHPFQKPIELFQRIIKSSSNENDIVLDCFMGSGTTALASRLLNRHFIGFEINKEYYDISLQRLLNVPERLEKWIDS